MKSLENAEDLRARAEGFNPTLGEATGSPALLAQQRALESNASGKDLDAFAAKHDESNAAIEAFRQKEAPAGKSDTDFVLRYAGSELYIIRERDKGGGLCFATRQGGFGRRADQGKLGRIR